MNRLLALAQRSPLAIVLIVGLAAGVMWGVNARLWMRFISTSPEFSWAGTLFIVLGFGVVGLAQSAAYLGRRAALRRRAMTALRVVAIIGLLPLGVAAGASMFPTIILGTLALTQRAWPRWFRGLLAGVALLPALATALTFFHDLSLPRAVVGTVWFIAIYAGIIWAARSGLAPQRDDWRMPIALRGLGVLALAPLAILAAMIANDLRGN